VDQSIQRAVRMSKTASNLKFSHSIDQLPESIQAVLIKSNIFYDSCYAFYIKSTFGKPVYIYSDDFLLFAVIISNKFVFRYANLPVEYVNLKGENTQFAKLFLNESMRLLNKKFHVQWTNPTFASALFLESPSKCLRIPFGSHIVELTDSEEVLWSKVHSKHRNSIRRAEKSGVKILSGLEEYLNDYEKLEKQTWERSGKSINNRYDKMVNCFGKNIIIFMAYKDQIPQGGAIYFYNKSMCYYMFSASKNNPEPGSMNFLHWKAMLYMKEHGVKKYSFVGCRINVDENSKYHDIQRFKERFGGELKIGYMFKVINNAFLYRLFKLLVKLKSNQVYFDSIDQEIHKWES
jgi:lipid II:glycine glycyltransferase (peptidoglycan interpeptide bridge formation enzyme)